MSYEDAVNMCADIVFHNTMDGSMNPWSGVGVNVLSMVYGVTLAKMDKDITDAYEQISEAYRARYARENS